MSEAKRFFTWKAYDKLSAPQARLLRILYEELSGQTFPRKKPSTPDELEYKEDDVDGVLDLYADGDGCVPSHHVDDDVWIPILKKFRGPVDVAIDLVERELVDTKRGQQYTLRRVIQPSYEDECKVVVMDWRDGYPFVYFTLSVKAWHYNFDNLAELADEIETIRKRILAAFLHLNNNMDIKTPVVIPE